MFSQASVILSGGGARVWLGDMYGGGMHDGGSVHSREACMVGGVQMW